MALAKELAESGTVPEAAKRGELYDVNPTDLVLSRAIDWDQMDLGGLANGRRAVELRSARAGSACSARMAPRGSSPWGAGRGGSCRSPGNAIAS